VIILILYDSTLYLLNYFLLLLLFFIIVDKLIELKDKDYYLEKESGIDLFNDLDYLRVSLLSRLDPFLRVQIQKRAINKIKKYIQVFIQNMNLKTLKPLL
jgi:hypothetical protein